MRTQKLNGRITRSIRGLVVRRLAPRVSTASLVNCRAWSSTLFLSCEPLLGPIDLFEWLHAVDIGMGHDYNMGIDWVIVGGESGPNHRALNLDHVRTLRDQCKEAGVPFFFKQHGGATAKAGGCLLDGVEYKQFPTAA